MGWIIGSSTRQRSLALFLVGSEFVLVFVFFFVCVFLFAIFCHHICLCLCYDGVRLTIGSNSGHRSLVAFMVRPREREKRRKQSAVEDLGRRSFVGAENNPMSPNAPTVCQPRRLLEISLITQKHFICYYNMGLNLMSRFLGHEPKSEANDHLKTQ